MSYAPFFRGLALAGLALGLAACCTPGPQGHRPPPPSAFGPGGPPPPPRDHDDRRGPPAGIEDAITTCADALGLPPPSFGDRQPLPALTDDQRALMDACLEDQGYAPPPDGPESEERPV